MQGKKLRMKAIGKLHTNPLGLEAVIIYDDLDLASRAVARLDKASCSGEEIRHWGLKWWRLEVLRVEESAAEALRESAGAHLLVLALRDHAHLGGSLARWLEKWAAMRREPDAAIALFDATRGGGLSLSSSPELSAFANEHGLNLIIEEEEAPLPPRPVTGGYAGIPLVLTPGLQAFDASPRFARRRDWEGHE